MILHFSVDDKLYFFKFITFYISLLYASAFFNMKTFDLNFKLFIQLEDLTSSARKRSSPCKCCVILQHRRHVQHLKNILWPVYVLKPCIQ